MAMVITPLCAGVCEAECVQVCPVECIEGPISLAEILAVPKPERAARLAGVQLYVNPDECIDCGACVAVCPTEAIFHEDDVPEEWSGSIAANEAFFAGR